MCLKWEMCIVGLARRIAEEEAKSGIFQSFDRLGDEQIQTRSYGDFGMVERTRRMMQCFCSGETRGRTESERRSEFVRWQMTTGRIRVCARR